MQCTLNTRTHLLTTIIAQSNLDHLFVQGAMYDNLQKTLSPRITALMRPGWNRWEDSAVQYASMFTDAAVASHLHVLLPLLAIIHSHKRQSVFLEHISGDIPCVKLLVFLASLIKDYPYAPLSHEAL